MTTTLVGTPDPEPEEPEHEVTFEEAIVRLVIELEARPIE